MILRCPCNGCIVDPVCKDPCDKFSEFIGPLSSIGEKVTGRLEAIDESLAETGVLRWIFETGGEFIFVPVVFCFVRHCLGIKTTIHEISLFDERFQAWAEAKEK